MKTGALIQRLFPGGYAVSRSVAAAVFTGAIYGLSAFALSHFLQGSEWMTAFWIAQAVVVGSLIFWLSEQTRRAALEIAAERAHADAAVETNASFLADMSHEIRTLMNGVIGFTEVLLAGNLDGQERGSLEMLADSGRAMLALLNELIDFARIEAGQIHVVSESFDLRQKLGAALTMMMPVAARKGLTLELAVDDRVPKRIESDPTRLRQIMLNLVGNAVKFTHSGRIDVTARVADGGRAVCIAVTDTGIGIAADKLDRIFEKFTQAENDTDRHYGGSGLGLTISAQLAELLGGAISVESEPGVGSTFTITLPLTASDAPESEDHEAAQVDFAPARMQAARILVAEDDPVSQQVTRGLLHHMGHQAEIVADGQQAIEQVRHAEKAGEPFDLVLMDRRLPMIDGLTAAKAIREAGIGAEKLPILALSADVGTEYAGESRDAGMQASLAKPLELQTLAAALDTWLKASPAAATANPAAQPSAGLSRRFAERKALALIAIDKAVASGEFDGCSLEDLIRQLHQIAGVASLFGEADLGTRCSELDDHLRTSPESVDVDQLDNLRVLLSA
ncbi:response regulator [Qipengyuania sp. 1XM1-15A]|uniref:ATP-binding protein n=1 Tax=Qipengyuania xiamenensis TaxID=2867237 RepID=UPI001C868C1A|nr:ATP-binding protein [Qipengyuania xiamenensis]MBX7533566.1 response regulator [Qipengyuania xiamenensis]